MDPASPPLRSAHLQRDNCLPVACKPWQAALDPGIPPAADRDARAVEADFAVSPLPLCRQDRTRARRRSRGLWEMRNGGQLLVDSLVALGATKGFGVPG